MTTKQWGGLAALLDTRITDMENNLHRWEVAGSVIGGVGGTLAGFACTGLAWLCVPAFAGVGIYGGYRLGDWLGNGSLTREVKDMKNKLAVVMGNATVDSVKFEVLWRDDGKVDVTMWDGGAPTLMTISSEAWYVFRDEQINQYLNYGGN